MHSWLQVTVLIFGLAMLGCGGQAEIRKTGGTYAGRGPNCEYRVIRNRIMEPYEEIGVIDIDAFGAPQLPNNEERFRKVAGPRVCAMGGDAVIPAINMYGRWVHGTVIRFHPSECDRCGAEVHSSPAIVDRPSVDDIPLVDDIKGEGG